jgi:hypothetical protein
MVISQLLIVHGLNIHFFRHPINLLSHRRLLLLDLPQRQECLPKNFNNRAFAHGRRTPISIHNRTFSKKEKSGGKWLIGGRYPGMGREKKALLINP